MPAPGTGFFPRGAQQQSHIRVGVLAPDHQVVQRTHDTAREHYCRGAFIQEEGEIDVELTDQHPGSVVVYRSVVPVEFGGSVGRDCRGAFGVESICGEGIHVHD